VTSQVLQVQQTVLFGQKGIIAMEFEEKVLQAQEVSFNGECLQMKLM